MRNKTDPRKLEHFLERREAYEGGLDDEVEELVDSLRQWQHEPALQPRPGFVNELAQQLQGSASAAPQKREARGLWRQASRRLAGAVTVAAVVAFVLFVVGLFSQPPAGPASDDGEDAPTATAPSSQPTPLPVGLSLSAPGWIHYVEQVNDGTMATVDRESGEIVTLRTDFQNEIWALLNDDGLVIKRVSQVRDLDGNLLQTVTLRDGVSRNLTFGSEGPDEVQPAPLLPWADPNAPVYHDPQEMARVQLLSIERVDAPPPEVMVLLQQEIEHRACEGVRLVDDDAWSARTLYEQWLDTLVDTVSGAEPAPWLYVVRERRQNEATINHDENAMPGNYRFESWMQLDEAARIVAQVTVLRVDAGAPFEASVIRDGVYYDLVDDFQRPLVPQRAQLDSGFFANVDTMDPRSRELGGEESQVGQQPAVLFSACQSYDGARPRIGDLPNPVVGEQRYLWLDPASGQVLRSARAYVDTTTQMRMDWIEDVTVAEVVATLPPEAEALWQEVEDVETGALPATPARPAEPYAHPGITFTLRDVTRETHETAVSLAVTIAGVPDGEGLTGASLANPVLIDEKGNRYLPGLGRGNSRKTATGLLLESTQTFQPGASAAEALTLQTGLALYWPADGTITLDLRGREPGDRWAVNETIVVYGLPVSIVEAALVNDPDAPLGALSLQLIAPCVRENGVELFYLELMAEGAADMGDGPGGNACDNGQEQMVTTLTIESLLDGSAPDTLEAVVLQLSGSLYLVGPWELSLPVEASSN